MKIEMSDDVLELLMDAQRMATTRGMAEDFAVTLKRGCKAADCGRHGTVAIRIDSPTYRDDAGVLQRASFLLVGEVMTIGMIDFGENDGWSLHS